MSGDHAMMPTLKVHRDDYAHHEFFKARDAKVSKRNLYFPEKCYVSCER